MEKVESDVEHCLWLLFNENYYLLITVVLNLIHPYENNRLLFI
jgi:hypothetical protein